MRNFFWEKKEKAQYFMKFTNKVHCSVLQVYLYCSKWKKRIISIEIRIKLYDDDGPEASTAEVPEN